MYVEKETDKAFLMCKDAVSFWIQKRWLRDRDGVPELTKAGWKAYHMAAREHWKRFGFDALKEFTLVRETGKAVLLRCDVETPDGSASHADFWAPKSMTGDWGFIRGKIRELEAGFPFIGTRVKWRGMDKEGYGHGSGKGKAAAALPL